MSSEPPLDLLDVLENSSSHTGPNTPMLSDAELLWLADPHALAYAHSLDPSVLRYAEEFAGVHMGPHTFDTDAEHVVDPPGTLTPPVSIVVSDAMVQDGVASSSTLARKHTLRYPTDPIFKDKADARAALETKPRKRRKNAEKPKTRASREGILFVFAPNSVSDRFPHFLPEPMVVGASSSDVVSQLHPFHDVGVSTLADGVYTHARAQTEPVNHSAAHIPAKDAHIGTPNAHLIDSTLAMSPRELDIDGLSVPLPSDIPRNMLSVFWADPHRSFFASAAASSRLPSFASSPSTFSRLSFPPIARKHHPYVKVEQDIIGPPAWFEHHFWIDRRGTLRDMRDLAGDAARRRVEMEIDAARAKAEIVAIEAVSVEPGSPQSPNAHWEADMRLEADNNGAEQRVSSSRIQASESASRTATISLAIPDTRASRAKRRRADENVPPSAGFTLSSSKDDIPVGGGKRVDADMYACEGAQRTDSSRRSPGKDGPLRPRVPEETNVLEAQTGVGDFRGDIAQSDEIERVQLIPDTPATDLEVTRTHLHIEDVQTAPKGIQLIYPKETGCHVESESLFPRVDTAVTPQIGEAQPNSPTETFPSSDDNARMSLCIANVETGSSTARAASLPRDEQLQYQVRAEEVEVACVTEVHSTPRDESEQIDDRSGPILATTRVLGQVRNERMASIGSVQTLPLRPLNIYDCNDKSQRDQGHGEKNENRSDRHQYTQRQVQEHALYRVGPPTTHNYPAHDPVHWQSHPGASPSMRSSLEAHPRSHMHPPPQILSENFPHDPRMSMLSPLHTPQASVPTHLPQGPYRAHGLRGGHHNQNIHTHPPIHGPPLYTYPPVPFGLPPYFQPQPYGTDPSTQHHNIHHPSFQMFHPGPPVHPPYIMYHPSLPPPLAPRERTPSPTRWTALFESARENAEVQRIVRRSQRRNKNSRGGTLSAAHKVVGAPSNGSPANDAANQDDRPSPNKQGRVVDPWVPDTTSQEELACPLCPRTFKLPNSLAIHLKWHCGASGLEWRKGISKYGKIATAKAAAAAAREAGISEDADPLRFHYSSFPSFLPPIIPLATPEMGSRFLPMHMPRDFSSLGCPVPAFSYASSVVVSPSYRRGNAGPHVSPSWTEDLFGSDDDYDGEIGPTRSRRRLQASGHPRDTPESTLANSSTFGSELDLAQM